VGYGADIDAEDRELWTPLHASAACENFAMVQYLVENGANVAAINADGNLPADLVEEDEELRKYLHDEMNKHGKLLLPLNAAKSTQGSSLRSLVSSLLSRGGGLPLEKAGNPRHLA